MGNGKKFDDSLEYNVFFIPRECFSHTWIGTEPPVFDSVTVRLTNGVISATYTFDEEQEWVISLKPITDQKISPKKVSLEFSVYAMKDDLYELNPYRGDLHSHSTGSDGREDPTVVAANYRKEGFDFFALTDHRNWDSSNELVETYSSVQLGFKIFRGEEPRVHGSYRMVKYVRFLLDYYFPAHDELCVEEGILMREYALGDAEAGDRLCAIADRVKRNMNKTLRGEE